MWLYLRLSTKKKNKTNEHKDITLAMPKKNPDFVVTVALPMTKTTRDFVVTLPVIRKNRLYSDLTFYIEE